MARRGRAIISFWAALLTLMCSAAWAGGAVLTMHPGDADVLAFDGLTTVATGDPAVADVVPLSSRRLLINAKGAGHTTLVILDRRGKHLVRITVAAPGPNMAAVATQIQADIGLPTVTAQARRDVIFLEGTVPTAEAAQRAEAIAAVYAPQVRSLVHVVPDKPAQSPAEVYAALLNDTWGGQGIMARVMDPQTIALTGTYTPPAAPAPDAAPEEPALTDDLTGTDTAQARRSRSRTTAAQSPLDKMLATLPTTLTVVNLVQTGERPAQQVLVRAKVIDIQRDAIKQLGVQWGSLTLGASRGGDAYVLQSQPILFGQAIQNLTANPLGGGPLKRLSPLAASLTALITENKARVLSEPSLLVRDGAEGSILVGGEIPIPVAQTNSGYAGATVTVEYKPYGVRLRVQPVLVAGGTIELTTTPEVSDLDYGNGVSFNGLSIPAISVRRATSTLQLRDGETLVIGGLYSNAAQRQVERIPLLSQIPVLGEFFKYTSTRKTESELLILLSVEVVPPGSPDVRPPVPGGRDNPGIALPDITDRAFQGDFPDLEHRGRPDPDAPKTPVNLPAAGGTGGP